MPADNTPILVGSGQYVVRTIESPEEALSPVELATKAAQAALEDSACAELTAQLDTVAMVRLFMDSSKAFKHPFGSCNKPPLSVAQRIGAKPERAIYGNEGGQSPQRFVNEFAEAIHAGTSRAVLICGAEATAAMKTALRNKWQLDWSEDLDGEIEDRGFKRLQSDMERDHGITFPPQVYALFENAWRAKQGLSVAEHQQVMARLFSRFSEIAADNPYSQFPVARDNEFLATPSKENYPINIPHNKWFVAQDAVNQGAAVVMTSVGLAKEIGIPESQWVYLHGYADADDTWVSERPDLAASNAIATTSKAALSGAGRSIDDMDLLDIYSCFPIAVLAACDAMGIDWQTEKALTVTGGLPFFGGAGNNYSLHAIAEITTQLRQAPGQFGLVSANGGYLSKQSVGIYSTASVEAWQAGKGSAQSEVDAQATIDVTPDYSGDGIIETYSLVYAKGQPQFAFVVGRNPADQKRFLARTEQDDTDTLLAIQSQEPIGRTIRVQSTGSVNEFKLA